MTGDRASQPASRLSILRNKRAFFEYHVLERLEAGLVLQGSEVKSLRERLVDFADSYCRIAQDEAWLLGLHIKPWPQATCFKPDPVRKRKLLLHRAEIQRLYKKVTLTGQTLVPLELYFKGGKVKVEIALVKGKKLHDKRQAMKERDASRHMRGME